MSTSTDEFLAHHGIKGMKWGIRRTPEQLGRRDARRQEIDDARSRVVNRTTKIKAAKEAYKKAKSAANVNKQIATSIKNGKEFAQFLIYNERARNRKQFAAAPGDPKTQSKRANDIDTARANQSKLDSSAKRAKTALKNLKKQQERDKVVGSRIRDGKDFATYLLAGSTIRDAMIYKKKKS